MSGAGDNLPRGILQPLRGVGDRRLALRVERCRRIVAHLFQRHLQAALPLDPGDKRPQLAVHLIHQRIADIAHINRKSDLSRHYVTAIRIDLHSSYRTAPFLAAPGNRHHFLHNAGRYL